MIARLIQIDGGRAWRATVDGRTGEGPDPGAAVNAAFRRTRPDITQAADAQPKEDPCAT